MNPLRNPEFHTLSDRQLQARLERDLAARKVARDAIDQRIATKRSQFRADSRLPFRPVTVIDAPVVPKPVPALIRWPVIVVFALTMTFAVWKFAAWVLPVAWGGV